MSTIENIRDRINSTKLTFGWTENSISPDPATQKRLNRQLSHGASITVDTLLVILNAFPISANWLLLGTGQMRIEAENDKLELIPIIKSQEKTISYLRERLETLEGKKNLVEVG